MRTISAFASSLLLFSPTYVYGQVVFLSAQGRSASGVPMGPIGSSLGLDLSNFLGNPVSFPPTQQAVSSWEGAGSTQSGPININSAMNTLLTGNQVAQGTPGGQMMMVAQPINGDPNAPFICAIDQTAEAQVGSWTSVDVSAQAQTRRRGVVTTPFPLVVNLPEDMECTGSFPGYKSKKVCLIRCQNFQINGPSGGVMPFEQLRTRRRPTF
ncbi:hypothetical protein TWF694_001325 [Orbilia ellipsospora]|uniref:Uncharacterized protein n=1 Tax=Orbilia ellipsospora TaxID=2528407 RepID=A0AAV9XRQ3_9PEZI